MDTSPEKYVRKLIDLSKNKFELLNDIFYLTKDQSLTINDEGLDRLKELLEKRQKKMDEIDSIDTEFNLYFKRLKFELKVNSLEDLKGSKTPGIKELQDIVGSIISIINKISELDSGNNERAKNMQSELGNEIKKVNQRKFVGSAYTPKVINPNSHFFDKKK